LSKLKIHNKDDEINLLSPATIEERESLDDSRASKFRGVSKNGLQWQVSIYYFVMIY
jgi:hypothetical protein